MVLVPTNPVEIDGQLRVGWFETDPVTGHTSGMLDDGTHGVKDYAALGAFYGFIAGVVFWGIEYSLQAQGHTDAVKAMKTSATVTGIVDGGISAGGSIAGWTPGPAATLILTAGTVFGVTVNALNLITGVDPPVPEFLYDLQLPSPIPSNFDRKIVAATQSLATPTLSTSTPTRNVNLSGSLTATWTSSAVYEFRLDELRVADADVFDQDGNLVGSGAVSLQDPSSVLVKLAGMSEYTSSGRGSLALYGTEDDTSVIASTWDHYSLAVDGTMTASVATGALEIGGVTLPQGTYEVKTHQALLSGSGPILMSPEDGEILIIADDASTLVGPGQRIVI